MHSAVMLAPRPSASSAATVRYYRPTLTDEGRPFVRTYQANATDGNPTNRTHPKRAIHPCGSTIAKLR